MTTTEFEALVIEYKTTQDENLLDQIADINDTDPDKYEWILNKHKVSY